MREIGLVATDLDGTLLDFETYDFSPARPALEALHAAGVPLVLASAKTAAEMAALAPVLGATAVVVENGGAVVACFPDALDPAAPWQQSAGGGWRLVLGPTRDALLAVLPEVAREAGASVRPFAALSVDEVVALTGLPPEDAGRAMEREHDEPFLVTEPLGRDLEVDARLEAAAIARGLRVTHGGRLHHLTGPVDKADALRALVATWPGGLEGRLVALGDAANDLPLLLAADRPIVMPRADGSIDPALAARLHGSERAPLPGPAGWGAAVLAVLRGGRLAPVDA